MNGDIFKGSIYSSTFQFSFISLNTTGFIFYSTCVMFKILILSFSNDNVFTLISSAIYDYVPNNNKLK